MAKKRNKNKTTKRKPSSGAKNQEFLANDLVEEVELNEISQNATDNEAQEAVVPAKPECQHAKKSANIQAVRKKLKNRTVGKCDECLKDKKEPEGGFEALWLCLMCGHQGCGRYSTDKHALTHFELPKTGNHPLALNLGTNQVWCYSCDDEVPMDSSKHLKEAVLQLKSDLNSSLRKAKANNLTSQFDAINKSHAGQKPNASEPEQAPSFDENTGRVVGLQNLGNTCFFNSVMQSLAQTHALGFALADWPKETTVTLKPETFDQDSPPPAPLDVELSLGDEILSITLVEFFKKFHANNKSTTMSPQHLFSQITKKAPRFRGYQQQDSHELLRYLLDGLRGEDTKRIQKAIGKAFGFSDKQLGSKDGVDEEKLKQLNAYKHAAPLPLVDRVFGGDLLQLITCASCGHVSHKLEPFLDLSLPISDAKLVPHAKMEDMDEDLDGLSQEKRLGPSKHQRKKERKDARRKGKKSLLFENGTEATENEANEVQENGAEKDAKDAEDPVVNGLASELARTVSMDSVSSKASQSSQEETPEITLSARLNTTLSPQDTSNYKESKANISSCLSAFTASEHLSGKNKFGCTFCAKRNDGEPMANGVQDPSDDANQSSAAKKEKVVYVEAEKRYLIYSPPAVLTLHLKRFQQLGFTTRKLTKTVAFPLLLDIAPYCCKYGQRVSPGQEHVYYSLYALVSHSGGLHGGHYVAYVRVRSRDETSSRHFTQTHRTRLDVNRNVLNEGEEFHTKQFTPPSGKWYYISDSHYREVSQDTVLKAEAYLLFYERIL